MTNTALSPKERLKLFEEVFTKGTSVSNACKKYNVSRFTFYKWAKYYQPEKSKSDNIKLLRNRVRKIENFYKQSPRVVEEQVKKIAAQFPDLSKYGLGDKVKEKLGSDAPGIHGVYNILKRAGLNTTEARLEYSRYVNEARKRTLTPAQREELIHRAINLGVPVAQVCRDFQVSRFTFYKWKNRWEKAGRKIDALCNQRPDYDRSHLRVGEELEKKVLSLVAKKPHLSKYELTKLVNGEKQNSISAHGVYNILLRKGLNQPKARYAYAEAQSPAVSVPAVAVDRPKSIWEQFIPSLAPAPPPSFYTIIKYVTASSISSFIFFTVVSSCLRIVLKGESFPDYYGVVFASTAFLMGSVFFLYSLKYYLTLAIVLSFSQAGGRTLTKEPKKNGVISWLLGFGGDTQASYKMKNGTVGLLPNLDHITIERYPYISIHIPLYNERKVVERLLKASTSFDYPGEYEVIICDDSTDETSTIIKNYQLKHLSKEESLKKVVNTQEGWELTSAEVFPGVTLKHLHRSSRSGFKGGALRLALKACDFRTEFVSVFDADFVPYPDTLALFLKYFQATAGTLDFASRDIKSENNTEHSISDHVISSSNIAAVQGYQWHVLNKSENWITRGVRSEYAGSYVIERSGTEIYGGLKQISGSVYMIRKDVLTQVGWGTSITEDFELTLRLYAQGYKVAYTPYIQAPAECVSTLERLIRQRMRWAEGHSFNIKKMFFKLLTNPKLTISEKLEFLYLSPYYLQAFFFLVGTLSWLLSETVFHSHLPFWTSLWGWSLVLTNMISLPLMNAVGLFLEESEEKDYLGIASFVALSYLVVPFQAYAALKGFLEDAEGPWFRTPKTGRITDIFTKGKFYRFISGFLPGKGQALGGSGGRSAFNSALPSSYLALSSANNTFDGFKVRPRKSRFKFIGRSLLAVLIIITLGLNLSSGFVVKPLSKDKKIVDTKMDVLAAENQVEKTVFEAKEGQVEPQDTPRDFTEETSVDEEYRFKANLSGGEVLVQERLNDQAKVKLTALDGSFLEFDPLFFDTQQAPLQTEEPSIQDVQAPSVEENKVSYQFAGGELAWETFSNHLKETIILRQKPESNVFSFGFQSDLKIALNGQGTFSGFDSRGNEVFIFSQPTVVSADMREGQITLDFVSGQAQLTIDQVFLDNAAYPVTIDPSVVYAQGIVTATAYGNQRKIFRDSSGNLIAVYVDVNQDTRVSYVNSGNTAWVQYSTVMDNNTANVGAALDSSGNLHLALADYTDASLVYYIKVVISRSSGVIQTSGWTINARVTLEGTTANNAIARPSIIVDAVNDRPAVTWVRFHSTGGTRISYVKFSRCYAGGACTVAADWIGANTANAASGLVVDNVGADRDQEMQPVLVQMPDPAGSNTYDNALFIFYTMFIADDLEYNYAAWDSGNSKWSAWQVAGVSLDASISTTDANKMHFSAVTDSSTTCNGTVDGCILVAYWDSDDELDITMINAAGTSDTSTFDPATNNYYDVTLSANSGVYTLIGADSAGNQIIYSRYSGSWSSYILDRGDTDDNENRYPSATVNANTDGITHVIYTEATASPYRISYAAIGVGNVPSGGAQYTSDHSTVISTGGSTTDGVSTNVFLDFDVSSPSKGDTLTPKVEVENTSTAFDNATTATGNAVIYDAEDPDDTRASCTVYDDLNDQMVVWGGYTGNTTKANTNDAWTLSLKEKQRSQWKKLTTSGTPPQANRAHVCVYDALNDRIVVYGGWNGSTYLTVVWALTLPTSGTPTWSQLSVSGSPPSSGQQLQACAVYDPSPSRMVVYGGYYGTDTDTDVVAQLTLPSPGTPTWSTLIGTTASTPSASGAGRDGQACVYDSDSDRMVMFGGHINAQTNESWELNLAAGSEAWTRLYPANEPTARNGIQGVLQPDYSSTDDRMIVFGGFTTAYVADIYELTLPENGLNLTWTEKTPAAGQRPQIRGYGGPNGVYDPLNTRALYFGGFDTTYYANEVIALDLTDTAGELDFYVLNDVRYLRERDGHRMFYDSENSQMYIFGGAGRGLPAYAYHVAETWKMNTSGTPVWKDVGVGYAPIHRELSSFIYDPLSGGRGVMCLGLTIATYLKDCWTLSTPSSGKSGWTKINPSGTAPSARWGTAAVYDDLNDRMVVFGGQGGGGYLNDVLYLALPDGSGVSWSTPTTFGSAPSVRWEASAIYDPGRDRMIVFGGFDGTNYFNTVYELTLPAASTATWALLSPTGSAPAGRRGPVTVYDPDDGSGNARMIVFGGFDGTNQYNDVWQLTLPAVGDGVWSQLSPSGDLPQTRRSIGAAYDSANDRMIIQGGRRGSEPFFDDTWALSLGASPAWTRLDPEKTVPVSVAVSGLSVGTSYHWQAWTTGDIGDSTKASYGANLETAADFVIVPEKILGLLLLGPFFPGLVRKLKKRQKKKIKWRERSPTT